VRLTSTRPMPTPIRSPDPAQIGREVAEPVHRGALTPTRTQQIQGRHGRHGRGQMPPRIPAGMQAPPQIRSTSRRSTRPGPPARPPTVQADGIPPMPDPGAGLPNLHSSFQLLPRDSGTRLALRKPGLQIDAGLFLPQRNHSIPGPWPRRPPPSQRPSRPNARGSARKVALRPRGGRITVIARPPSIR
jgi:hypothetical protein